MPEDPWDIAPLIIRLMFLSMAVVLVLGLIFKC